MTKREDVEKRLKATEEAEAMLKGAETAFDDWVNAPGRKRGDFFTYRFTNRTENFSNLELGTIRPAFENAGWKIEVRHPDAGNNHPEIKITI